MEALAQLNSALAGRYVVDREIGAGGMATVYLATDIKHHRKVALKVLSPELGAVLGVERFLSEIRVTANLQHPNLLPLFDSGEANGLLFYVMPFVEGESLRAKLQHEKQLPVDDALRIAVAVAGALDYAHKHGVIHRDLKPENILLQSGQPVIADFGIALAISNAGGQRVTQTGISLGTPHYMSPEQATGDRQIDGRTDIYSLGAVLYEMLAGEPPHTGNTAQAVIARLLTDRPRPIRAARDTVPPNVEAAIERALAKLPADRFATAGEFAHALTDTRTGSAPSGASPSSDRRDMRIAFTVPMHVVRAALRWTLLVGAVALGAWGWLRPGRLRDENVVRFRLVVPSSERPAESANGSFFTMSPDGRKIVYLAADSVGTVQLFLRFLDQVQSRAIEGTRAARNPVFSPDGQWIAFMVGSDVNKVSVSGGPVIKLGTGAGGNGLSWEMPGTILAGGSELLAISAVGAPSRRVAIAEIVTGSIGLRWPYALPDGEHAVITNWGTTTLAGATLDVISLSTGERTPLNLAGTFPLRVIDGLLFYGAANGAIMAVPFDAKRLKTTGNPVPVGQDVLVDAAGGFKAAVSASGALVYLSGQSSTLPILYDGRGGSRIVNDDPRPYSTPRYSPDGQRIAFTVGAAQSIDVWVYDIAKTTLTRLTTEGSNMRPEWTPDGKRILFRSERQSGTAIWWQPADGSGPAEQLLRTRFDPFEALMAPDGKALIFRTAPGSTNSRDIFYVDLKGDSTPKPLVVSPYQEQMPRVSPDGKWMAYMSDETGQFEIYVRPFPNAGGRIQVSTSGGTEPLWSRDGRTLYYRSGARLTAASVTTTPTFAMGGRTVVLEGDFVPNATHQNWDIAPDGRHYLMIKRAGGEAQTIVVHNWIQEVRARMSAAK